MKPKPSETLQKFIRDHARTVTTLRTFQKEVEEISAAWAARNSQYPPVLWFRGHSNIAHELVPTRYRDELAGMEWGGEREMMLEFRRKATGLVRPVASWWDWVFLGRHHGLPTRLL